MTAPASVLPYVSLGGVQARLEFTPNRVEPIGRIRIDALFLAAVNPGPDQMRAMADLIDIASGGEIPAGLVMMERPDADLAVPALYEAWLFSWRGPPKRLGFLAAMTERAKASLARLLRPRVLQEGTANV